MPGSTAAESCAVYRRRDGATPRSPQRSQVSRAAGQSRGYRQPRKKNKEDFYTHRQWVFLKKADRTKKRCPPWRLPPRDAGGAPFKGFAPRPGQPCAESAPPPAQNDHKNRGSCATPLVATGEPLPTKFADFEPRALAVRTPTSLSLPATARKLSRAHQRDLLR